MVTDTTKIHNNHSWYEDFNLDDQFEFGHWVMTREDMLDFANKYDPEPFHTDDDEAIRLGWNGIIASGLQITCICRQMQNSGFPKLEVVISPGWDNIRWFKPVYTDDILTCKATVIEAKPLGSRPGEGLIKMDNQLYFENGDKVAQMITNWFLRYKPNNLA